MTQLDRIENMLRAIIDHFDIEFEDVRIVEDKLHKVVEKTTYDPQKVEESGLNKELNTYWDMRSNAQRYGQFASQKQKNYLKSLEKKLLEAELIQDKCEITKVREAK